MSAIEYQVWWVPQVPMKPFTALVPSLDEGRRLCDVLAKYDDFQFKNKVKPDYCNAGGVQLRHPIVTDGEWIEWFGVGFAAYLLARFPKGRSR